MHVVHLIRDLDAASGGPSRSVPALARSLAAVRPEVKVTVIFQDRGTTMAIDPTQEQRVRFLPVSAAMRTSSLGEALAKVHYDDPVSVVHSHGIWSPTLHRAVRRAMAFGVPHVISPRGMLSMACMGTKPVRKSVAWRLYQRQDLQRAALIHATSTAEREDCLQRGLRSPVHVIPNGCELPSTAVLQRRPKSLPVSDGQPFAIALGRVDPVKGLDTLIDAWEIAAPRSWRLLIAGPGNPEHVDSLRRRIANAGLSELVHWIGPLEEGDKWAALRAASFLVNASKSENFGMAIAEALACETPVIATQGTPWDIVERERCGWWVEGTIGGVATAIRLASAKSEVQLREMGQRGRCLVSKQFDWSSVASKMLACYEQAMR
ncbi:Mannosylfructose-phosphate synthase [Rosistilla carotiformis]|uniref:Mannosylfructose-phosphate synthase n=1 Tax=Rosistilla carotiformis TaxID=2528017 RepID=A0A518JVF4_9BACT|nr:glycosyltransferase [Rosistilla carotiformis]QDV69509.1 Mannosylfructose-phosphate synthase [Rosistilla carotiformis]